MKSDCSIIDSDSDSCGSSVYQEEQDVEYDKEEEDNEYKDNDKGKKQNQHEEDSDNDGRKWNEESMDRDISMIEDHVNSSKEGNHHAKRTTRRTETSTAEPYSVLETDASLANVEMQYDSVIATGQHHIWM